MFLTKSGTTDSLTQYECKNLPQVKNTVNELTKTKSQNSDWKEICDSAKNGNSDSIDYTCFIDGKETECSVGVGYDASCGSYFVWVEV